MSSSSSSSATKKPKELKPFGEKTFWDEFYKNEVEPFDWYMEWGSLSFYCEKYLKENSVILDVGCGSSRLVEQLYYYDYQNVYGIDYSEPSIKVQQKRESETNVPSDRFIQADVLDKIPFEDQKFDVIFDKATSDSILCGKNSHSNIRKYLGEISGVLKVGGLI